MGSLSQSRGACAAAYPWVHAALQREVLGGSLLFTWKGSDAALPPLLLVRNAAQ